MPILPGSTNRFEISVFVASKSSGTGQWLAIIERPPAPTNARTKPSSAKLPPVAMPASRVAAMVAIPAVSQAERMIVSASSRRSKISLKVSRPSELLSPKDVTSEGWAGQEGRGAVTRPCVAKCRTRKSAKSVRSRRAVSLKALPVSTSLLLWPSALAPSRSSALEMGLPQLNNGQSQDPRAAAVPVAAVVIRAGVFSPSPKYIRLPFAAAIARTSAKAREETDVETTLSRPNQAVPVISKGSASGSRVRSTKRSTLA